MTEPQPNIHVMTLSQASNYPVGQTWASQELDSVSRTIDTIHETYESPNINFMFEDDMEYHFPVQHYPMITRIREMNPLATFGLWVDITVSRPGTSLRGFENLISRARSLPSGNSLFISSGKPLKLVQELRLQTGLAMLKEGLPNFDIYLSSPVNSTRKVAEELSINLLKPQNGFRAEKFMNDRTITGLAPFISASGTDVFTFPLGIVF